MPPIAAPVLAAGIGLLGSGINAISQIGQNAKNRRHAEKMAQWQRDAALTDWGMEMKYNSPEEQMKRLRAAGLNANLVYGNGADATVGGPRGTSMASAPGQAPQIDAGGIVSSYFDAQIKTATADNLKAQNDLIRQQAAHEAVKTVSSVLGIDKTKVEISNAEFELMKKNSLLNYDLTAAELQNQLSSATTKSIMDANIRENAMFEPKFTKAVMDISTQLLQNAKTEDERKLIKQNIENAKKDGSLKDIEIELRKLGIFPNDPWYVRKVQLAVKAIAERPSKSMGKAGNQVGKAFEKR